MLDGAALYEAFVDLADARRELLQARALDVAQRCAEWIRNNYQEHPTIDGLCEAMIAAIGKDPK